MLDKESRPWFTEEPPLAGYAEDVVHPAESVRSRWSRRRTARCKEVASVWERFQGATHTAVVNF